MVRPTTLASWGGCCGKRYQFPAEGIVTLTEDEGSPARRPTRANIEREFRRLADQAREGDQVVILLAGHGARQPEPDPPDPDNPEPDGLDEIFLPADVDAWKATRERRADAHRGRRDRGLARAIAAKRAYVWAIFDCCHSGTMTRGTEVGPRAAAGNPRASGRAGQGSRSGRPGGRAEPAAARPRARLVPAAAAVRLSGRGLTPAGRTSRLPEGFQPPGSPGCRVTGLLTLQPGDVLTKSADSKTSLTYRELVRRLQARYAGRPQGSPTPLVEGRRARPDRPGNGAADAVSAGADPGKTRSTGSMPATSTG